MAAPDDLALLLAQACTDQLRAPSNVETDADTGLPIILFDPPLTEPEAELFTSLFDFALELNGIQRAIRLAPEVYDAIRPSLQTIRDFRQLGRNGFMALPSDAERFRRLYDVATARTAITLALVRSS